MATESIAAAIRITQASAKAIPVVGGILEGILGTVMDLYKEIESVKANYKRAKELVERVAQLSHILAEACISRTIDAGVDDKIAPRLIDLKGVLADVLKCLGHLKSPGSSSGVLKRTTHFLKRAAHASSDNEELQRLSLKIEEAIEHFQLSASIDAYQNNLLMRAEEEKRFIHAVLQPLHEAIYDSFMAPPGCLEGTRKDVLADIVRWAFSESGASTPERIFWLCGMAGTGKSAIAKSVSDSISNRIRTMDSDDGTTHLISFFITRHVANHRNPLRILHTLVYFLSRSLPTFRRVVHQALSERPELTALTLKTQMEDLFGKPLAACREAHMNTKIVVVIDAFDECDKVDGREGGDFLPQLLAILSQTDIHIRLLFTSRNERTISDMFQECRAQRSLRLHEIDKFTVNADIHAYLRHNFPSASSDRLLSLTAKANGLFIYAATVVRFSRSSDFFEHTQLLDLILANTSPDRDEQPMPSPDYALLDGMYTQILRNALPSSASPQYVDAAAAVIRSVIMALVLVQEFVSSQTLAMLLGFREQQVSQVLAHLSSVLIVESSGVIRPHHLSFAEFLLDPMRCNDPAFQLQDTGMHTIARHHSSLMHGCIRVMNAQLCEDICRIKEPCLLNAEVRDLRSRIQRYIPEGLQYASKYWCIHISLSTALSLLSASTRDRFTRDMELFCQEHISHWLEVISILGYFFQGLPSLPRAIEWCKDLGSFSAILSDVAALPQDLHHAVASAALQLYITCPLFLPEGAFLDSLGSTSLASSTPIFLLREVASSWDTASEPQVMSSDNRVAIISLAGDSDGSLFAIAVGNRVSIWDSDTYSILTSLTIDLPEKTCIRELHVSADASCLVVSIAADHGSFAFFEPLTDVSLIYTLHGDHWFLETTDRDRYFSSRGSALSHDARYIAFHGTNLRTPGMILRVEGLREGELVAEYPWILTGSKQSRVITQLALSSNGSLVAAVDERHCLAVWNVGQADKSPCYEVSFAAPVRSQPWTRFSFDGAGSQLLYGNHAFQINESDIYPRVTFLSTITPPTFEIASDGWLYYQSQTCTTPTRLCWLPPARRPAARGYYYPLRWLGSTVVIGTEDGYIAVLRVDDALVWKGPNYVSS